MALDRTTADFSSKRVERDDDFEEQLRALILQAQAAKQARTSRNEQAFASASGQPPFSEGVGSGSQFAASQFLQGGFGGKGGRGSSFFSKLFGGGSSGSLSDITKTSSAESDVNILQNNPGAFIGEGSGGGGFLSKLFGGSGSGGLFGGATGGGSGGTAALISGGIGKAKGDKGFLGIGDDKKGVGEGFSGAFSGAQIGGQFAGPYGAIIGALIGGFAGGLS